MTAFKETRRTPDFLPMSLNEAAALGWNGVDFALVTGDAYVDHPSFGVAVIGKALAAHGFTVGVIARPVWNETDAFAVFGRPRLGFLVTSGNVDSMVNNYTVAKKRRRSDDYAPGGVNLRPDRALIVYSRAVRERFPDAPIVLGGLEASLRRLAHYDYWDDKVRRSVLLDADADLLVYGMGERAMVEIAGLLDGGVDVADITDVAGTVYRARRVEALPLGALELPSYDEVSRYKQKFAESFKAQYENCDYLSGSALTERYGKKLTVAQNPPAKPLDTEELDFVYGLNYARSPHPCYGGAVKSNDEVKFSVTSSRGCFGGCAFCALSFHQGRAVTSRSHGSIIAEIELLSRLPDFKGYIHDVGGPTANFRKPSCSFQGERGVCKDRRCLAPEPCSNLLADHSDYIELLRKARGVKGVKKVFVRSGVRYDYVMYDKIHGQEFLRELCEHHVSGQLKVAPEHVCDRVLAVMGKPSGGLYRRFARRFREVNEALGKKQFLVPYLMSSHPGSTLREAVELAEFLRDEGVAPEQVQDFYPTPATLSTAAYYTGVDVLTGEPVFCAKTPREKALQRALIQYRLPQNYALVREALKLAGREDLVGFGERCLVRPMRGEKTVAAEVEKPPRKKTIRNIHKKKVPK